jgi:hypothetical protein
MTNDELTALAFSIADKSCIEAIDCNGECPDHMTRIFHASDLEQMPGFDKEIEYAIARGLVQRTSSDDDRVVLVLMDD